jgi:hypothetical protein
MFLKRLRHWWITEKAMSLYLIPAWDERPFCHCGKRAKLRTSLEEITYGRRYWVCPDDDPWFEVNSFILNFTVVCLKLPSLLSHMFSLLPPSLSRWLSDASVSPFIMDADEHLWFTIINSSINLLERWTNSQSTFDGRSARGTASRRRWDLPAITSNSIACYGIVGNPVAGYALPAIPLPATVEISPNTRDCCMLR